MCVLSTELDTAFFWEVQEMFTRAGRKTWPAKKKGPAQIDTPLWQILLKSAHYPLLNINIYSTTPLHHSTTPLHPPPTTTATPPNSHPQVWHDVSTTIPNAQCFLSLKTTKAKLVFNFWHWIGKEKQANNGNTKSKKVNIKLAIVGFNTTYGSTSNIHKEETNNTHFFLIRLLK